MAGLVINMIPSKKKCSPVVERREPNQFLRQYPLVLDLSVFVSKGPDSRTCQLMHTMKLSLTLSMLLFQFFIPSLVSNIFAF